MAARSLSSALDGLAIALSLPVLADSRFPTRGSAHVVGANPVDHVLDCLPDAGVRRQAQLGEPQREPVNGDTKPLLAREVVQLRPSLELVNTSRPMQVVPVRLAQGGDKPPQVEEDPPYGHLRVSVLDRDRE